VGFHEVWPFAGSYGCPAEPLLVLLAPFIGSQSSQIDCSDMTAFEIWAVVRVAEPHGAALTKVCGSQLRCTGLKVCFELTK